MDDTHDDPDAALLHYRDRSRDRRAVTIGDEDRTDRGEVEQVAVDAGPQKDYLKVTVKIPIARHGDR